MLAGRRSSYKVSNNASCIRRSIRGCMKNAHSRSNIVKRSGSTGQRKLLRTQPLNRPVSLKRGTASTQSDLCLCHTPCLMFTTKLAMMIDSPRWMNSFLRIFKVAKHCLVFYGQSCQNDDFADWLCGLRHDSAPPSLEVAFSNEAASWSRPIVFSRPTYHCRVSCVRG